MFLHALIENELMPPKLLHAAVAKVLHQIATSIDPGEDIRFSRIYVREPNMPGHMTAVLYFKMPDDKQSWRRIVTQASFKKLLDDNFIPGTLVFKERTVGGNMHLVEVFNVYEELQIDYELLKAVVSKEFNNEETGIVVFV